MENLFLSEFVQRINQLRKQKGWYTFQGIVEGMQVEIKGYNTWLQVYRVVNPENNSCVNYSNCMERKIKQFNGDLILPFV